MLKVQHFKGLIINLNVNKGLINAFSRLSKKKKKERERKKEKIGTRRHLRSKGEE